MPASLRARIPGLVYLLYFVLAIGADMLVKRGNAFGYTLNVMSVVVYAAVIVIFYHMFAHVNRTVSAIACTVGLLGCAVMLLYGAHVVPVNPLLVFAFYCGLLGYLIVRSSVVPKFFGVLLLIAGVAWLLLFTPVGHTLTQPIEIIGGLSEVVLMLWLVIAGARPLAYAASSAHA